MTMEKNSSFEEKVDATVAETMADHAKATDNAILAHGAARLPGKGIDPKTRANIGELVATMENEKKSASPTEEKPPVIDWLLILPSAYPKESTLDMAMYFESEFPPPLIERRGKSYRLKSWTGGDSKKGTARYASEYQAREGEVYREWSDLRKATGKEMDAIIETWKEEFGEALDAQIGDGEGIASIVMDGEGRELRAGGWLNRDSDGCLDYLDWTITGIVSDKVGLRHVNVWKNNYPSDNKGAYGWEVRMGGAQLGVSGGVGMEKLVGYSKDLNTAKTDGMKALLEVNRVVELRAEEKKRMKDMISAPMMPKEDIDDS
jgi:hypothetical protein